MRNTSLSSQGLKYAAYAACNGYTIHGCDGHNPPNFVSGVPEDTLSFSIGAVRVFLTENGWRVATINRLGVFNPHKPADFHKRLFQALVSGLILHRQFQEADEDEIAAEFESFMSDTY